MKPIYLPYLALAVLLASINGSSADTTSANADDALVDGLVQEGLLSHAQADRIRDKITAAETETPLNKIALSDSVKSLTFYGDSRLRFENIDQGNHYEAPVVTDREFELESGTTNDSANQTMGSMFTKGTINIGKIYLRYDPTDFLTLYAGKFTNPLYTTTDMVYSFDENPEGGAEVFNFHPTDNLTVGLTAAQYLYINTNESTTTPNINRNDVFIIANQIPVTWKITKDLTFKVAPGFTFYTGGGNTNYDGGVPTNSNVGAGSPASLGSVTGSGGGTESLGTAVYYGGNANSSVDPVFYSPHEADDLAIISAPGEFDFLLLGVPMRPYWDFNMNLDGKGRVQDVYLDPTASAPSVGTAAAVKKANSALGDNLAWALGLQVGQNKKKGDWSGLVEFRQIGLGAVDQNINGTDFADSYANQEGFKLSLAYNFTDFLTGTLTYYDTWDYKSDLYKSLGGGNSAPTVGSTQYLVSAHTVQRFQADIGWKF
jgi:hypothetical protein